MVLEGPILQEENILRLRFNEIRISSEKGMTKTELYWNGYPMYTFTSKVNMLKGDSFHLTGFKAIIGLDATE